ncbi:MAG TPA: hypothetical protein DCZ94_20630 [Lentisphaeria bacterium]|nr:hypothetical protein [Lentisphaeria bacterium]
MHNNNIYQQGSPPMNIDMQDFSHRLLFKTCASIAIFTFFISGCMSAQETGKEDREQKNINGKSDSGIRVFHVAQKNPKATDSGPGDQLTPFMTISAAAAKAGPGDTVIVHSGTYREKVSPAKGGAKDKPVVYMSAEDGDVIIKGSDIWKPEWISYKNIPGVYEGKLDKSIFQERNPYETGISIAGSDRNKKVRPAETANLPRTIGQIFINSAKAAQVETLEDVGKHPNSWLVSPSGESIIVHFPGKNKKPEDYSVEISVRNRIFSPFRRGLGYITIRGFIFEHCANQGPFPQGGAVSVRSGHNWVIEDNTIRHAATIGLDCGSETWDCTNLPETHPEDKHVIIGGSHSIRNNVISDNGLCGIAGWNHGGTVIFGNIIERNNNMNFYTAYDASWEEWGGIKLHASNALVEGNLIRDNEGHGIWIDNGYENARITRNLVVNNRMAGIFLELGAGPVLIDNNIVAFTRPLGFVDRAGGDFYNGFGIYAHDASDLIVAHNMLLSNSGTGVFMRTITDRSYGGKHVETSNERIVNNVFYDNGRGAIGLPYPSQYAKGNISDNNLILARDPGELFVINEFKECPPGKEVVSALETKLKEAGIPHESRPNLSNWPAHPFLDMIQWRLLMKQDGQSIEFTKDLTILLRPRIPNISIKINDAFLAARSLEIDLVDIDYNGDAIPADHRLPGPFQNLKSGKNTITLWPVIGGCQTAERKFKTSMIANYEKYLHKPNDILKPENSSVEESFSFAGMNSRPAGLWTAARQPGVNPDFTGTYLKNDNAPGAEISAQASGGGQRSPSSVVFFNAPSDGWYQMEISGKLSKRISESAGFVVVTIYMLDAEGEKYRYLGEFKLNSANGYGGFPPEFKWDGEMALKQGWRIAVRMQIVSPGSAPAGSGNLLIDKFNARRLNVTPQANSIIE